MRKGNSSSELALNMPAGERQKRCAAYCMGVGRLFPVAARPLVLALLRPELLMGGGETGRKGSRRGREVRPTGASPVSRRVRLGVELLVAATHVRVDSG